MAAQQQGRDEGGLTERAMQLAVMQHIRSSIVCACPNYTPIGWWECDLWAVTKSGYAVEYEIKRTLADFQADRAKQRTRYWPVKEVKQKHGQMGSEKGPTRFFYVVPASLVEAVTPELPEWAGLISVEVWHRSQVIARQVKQATRLHSTKVKRREITLAHRRMWFRYWDSLRTIDRMVRERCVAEIPA